VLKYSAVFRDFFREKKTLMHWEIRYLHAYMHVFVWVFNKMRPVTTLSDHYESKD